MRKQAILVGAATVVVSIGVALAENQAPQQYDKSAAPSGVQSTTPDHPPNRAPLLNRQQPCRNTLFGA
jgi:hypothetical protein